MPRSSLPSRIYLVGFMGSGKSTVGPVLAKTLGYSFFELDKRVEVLAPKSIAGMLADKEEAAFRVFEAEAFREACSMYRTVVSTGGGTLINQESLILAQKTGAVVYLRSDTEALVERLHGVETRPLLLGNEGKVLSRDALRKRIASLLAERMPGYSHADFIVDVDRRSPEEIADAIVTALNARA